MVWWLIKLHEFSTDKMLATRTSSSLDIHVNIYIYAHRHTNACTHWHTHIITCVYIYTHYIHTRRYRFKQHQKTSLSIDISDIIIGPWTTHGQVHNILAPWAKLTQGITVRYNQKGNVWDCGSSLLRSKSGSTLCFLKSKNNWTEDETECGWFFWGTYMGFVTNQEEPLKNHSP